MLNNVTAKVYDLGRHEGNWLGEAVLTSDGMFSAVTDYGNFTYAWRAFGDDIEEFILKISPDYFASKLFSSFCYTMLPSKKAEKSIERSAAVILPALQNAIKESRK